ncbi:Probable transmembrane protein of unknown function [Tenacibaculum litopenaei]|uniref:hypothetical protein n=1 Tax=Tenacibaculum litopenaei TaxID=396016 RepID=UPI0038954102
MYVTIGEENPTLNGWFDGFCPSNGIADDLQRKADGIWNAYHAENRKLEALKKGKQAAEWASLKKEVARLDAEIKEHQRDLEKEKAIALAIGADITGLGAWCNGAVSRRKKAEESLRSAEQHLGKVRGALNTLNKQQTEGIKTAGELITKNKQRIEQIKGQINQIKIKIEAYKLQRDNERKQAAITNQEKKEAGKTDLKEKLKENAPWIVGGVLLATAGVLYLRKEKKKTKKASVKKVAA